VIPEPVEGDKKDIINRSKLVVPEPVEGNKKDIINRSKLVVPEPVEGEKKAYPLSFPLPRAP